MPPGDDRLFLQGLIQLAVALEHHRRGNPRGSAGQRTKAEAKLRPACPVFAGVAVEKLLTDADAHLAVGSDNPPQLIWARLA